MSSNHLIIRQHFDLRVPGSAEAHDIQQDISRLCVERLTPAFGSLFDRLAGPDQLIRLDKVEIDLGRVTRDELFTDAFTRKLTGLLEKAIEEAARDSSRRPTRLPLRQGRFELWLYFLEHGYLPADAAPPDSPAEWHRQIFETLAADERALHSLRRLLGTRPAAFERLLMQYDGDFLRQIVTLFTARDQEGLPAAVRAMAAALVACLRGPAAVSLWLARADFWQVLLRGRTLPAEAGAAGAWIAGMMESDAVLRKLLEALPANAAAGQPEHLLRQAGTRLWRILLEEAVLHERKVDAAGLLARALRHEALRHPRALMLKALTEQKTSLHRLAEAIDAVPEPTETAPEPVEEAVLDERKADAAGLPEQALRHEEMRHSRAVMPKALAEEKTSLRRLAEAIEAVPEPVAEAEPVEKQLEITGEANKPAPAEDSAENVHYVRNAGVVLLHPFLSRFFRKMDLLEGSVFKDERSRGMAASLLHCLATGEVHTPEYHLVLPKFLCGMPLNTPLDHTLAVDEEAREEAEQLLGAAIDHWGALGNSSPAAIRQGFLQRPGKLEKRESGWFLQVESNTIDVLLDRLPTGWGIGMLKLPWMEEVLRVEWR